MKMIKYYDGTTWQYCTVKGLGDVNALVTSTKDNLVDAINEIVNKLSNGDFGNGTSGSITFEQLPQELIDAVNNLQNATNGNTTSIGNINTEMNLINTNLTAKQTELEESIKNLTPIVEIPQEKYDELLANLKIEVGTMIDSTMKDYQTFIDTLQKETAQLKTDLDSKVNTETFNTKYSELNGKLTNIDNSVKLMDEKTSTVEKTVTDLKTEVGTKISSTEFTRSLGVDYWLRETFLNVPNLDTTTALDISILDEKYKDSEMEIQDIESLPFSSNSNQLTSFFTNLYFDTPTTLNLQYASRDCSSIYVNDALVYQTTMSNGEFAPLTLVFRQGWNKVQILLFNELSSSKLLSIKPILSDSVVKMSYVIGSGTSDGYKYKQMETELKQNKDSITALVGSVSDINGNVQINNSKLEIIEGQISTIVNDTKLDALTGRVQDAESKITQNADSINSKVSQTDFDVLNNKFTESNTEISQLKDSITNKVWKSDIDASGKTLETSILNQTANSLTTEIESVKSDYNGKIEKNTALINTKSGAIELSVSNLENDYNKRMSDAEASINVIPTQITSAINQQVFESNSYKDMQTKITQNTTDIGLRVTNTAFEEYQNTFNMEKVKTEIKASVNGIELDYDTISGKVGNDINLYTIEKTLSTKEATTKPTTTLNDDYSVNYKASVTSGADFRGLKAGFILNNNTKYTLHFKYKDNLATPALKRFALNVSGFVKNNENFVVKLDGVKITKTGTIVDSTDSSIVYNNYDVPVDSNEHVLEVLFKTDGTDATTSFSSNVYILPNFNYIGGGMDIKFSELSLNKGGFNSWSLNPYDTITEMQKIKNRLVIDDNGIMTTAFKNGMISTVKQDAESWQVDASKIVLNGNTIITNAKINSAYISDLSASKITSGTLTSINMVGGKISGGELHINSYGSSASSYTAGLHVASDGSLRIGSSFSVDKNGVLNASSGVFTGSITGATGTFSGNLSGSVITGGVINGSVINGSTIVSEDTFTRAFKNYYGSLIDTKTKGKTEIVGGTVRVSASSKTDANSGASLTNSSTDEDRAITLSDKGLTTQIKAFNATSSDEYDMRGENTSARFIDFFANEDYNTGFVASGMHIHSGQNMMISALQNIQVRSRDYVKLFVNDEIGITVARYTAGQTTAGVTIGGKLFASRAVDFSDSLTVRGSVTLGNSSSYSSNYIYGGLNVRQGLDVTGGCSISVANFSSTVTFDGSTTMNGSTTFNGNASFGSTTRFNYTTYFGNHRAKAVQSGTTTISAVADTATYTTISFSPSFSGAPALVASAQSNATSVVDVTVFDVTSSSAKLYINRKTSATTTINWVAVGSY